MFHYLCATIQGGECNPCFRLFSFLLPCSFLSFLFGFCMDERTRAGAGLKQHCFSLQYLTGLLFPCDVSIMNSKRLFTKKMEFIQVIKPPRKNKRQSRAVFLSTRWILPTLLQDIHFQPHLNRGRQQKRGKGHRGNTFSVTKTWKVEDTAERTITLVPMDTHGCFNTA